MHDDLPPLLAEDVPETVGARLEREWEKEIVKHRYNFFVDPRNTKKASEEGDKETDAFLVDKEKEEGKAAKPSLFKALWRSFGWKFFLSGVVKIGNDVMLFAGPVFLNLVRSHPSMILRLTYVSVPF